MDAQKKRKGITYSKYKDNIDDKLGEVKPYREASDLVLFVAVVGRPRPGRKFAIRRPQGKEKLRGALTSLL